MNLQHTKCRLSGLSLFSRQVFSPSSHQWCFTHTAEGFGLHVAFPKEFSRFAEPLEPQTSTKWAGGLPKPGLVERFPVLPVSNCAGKRQNSFFHSISFSFWCWLYPKRQRDNERDKRRKSTEPFHC